jgi:hypothetical protein
MRPNRQPMGGANACRVLRGTREPFRRRLAVSPFAGSSKPPPRSQPDKTRRKPTKIARSGAIGTIGATFLELLWSLRAWRISYLGILHRWPASPTDDRPLSAIVLGTMAERTTDIQLSKNLRRPHRVEQSDLRDTLTHRVSMSNNIYTNICFNWFQCLRQGRSALCRN